MFYVTIKINKSGATSKVAYVGGGEKVGSGEKYG